MQKTASTSHMEGNQFQSSWKVVKFADYPMRSIQSRIQTPKLYESLGTQLQSSQQNIICFNLNSDLSIQDTKKFIHDKFLSKNCKQPFFYNYDIAKSINDVA